MSALDFPATPTDGQIYGNYRWDDTVGVWRLIPESATSVSLDDLTDVDTAGVQDGDALVYDGANSEWVPGASAASLADLSDTAITTPTAGQKLVYDGTNWVNESEATFLGKIYPIGSIYINATNSTNPETLLGFGTWVAFGAGRVPVGFSSGESEFDAAEKTGGAKTHTLTTSQIPSHTHDVVVSGLASLRQKEVGGSFTGFAYSPSGDLRNDYLRDVIASASGGGGAHNNLQPYITVYMWKRTA